MCKTIDELLRSGSNALEKRDYKTAMADYQAAADMGSAEALVCLGNIYSEGFACRRNIAAAMECYKKAADMGSNDGMYGVAKSYRSGYGIDMDAENALELYEKSLDKALEWYEKAADNGNIKAMLQLAEKYISRNDVAGLIWFNQETDLEKAFFWYKKAITQAEETDTAALSEIYYRIGSDLLFSDITEPSAMEFVRKCAEEALKLGHRKANYLIHNIENRDELLKIQKSVQAEAIELRKSIESGDFEPTLKSFIVRHGF